jgi:hypothetical protein
MKKEPKLLLKKAVNSLILSIEHFNRPWEVGRVETVLILLDHAFEMFLKSAILERGGKIRQRNNKNTIGFDACIRKALSDGNIKFLSEEQALSLQAINSLRDAAQHHLLDISEPHLYIHVQTGFTLFRDLYESVFSLNLVDCMPKRALPVSTIPPQDIAALFDNEIGAILALLSPGKRKKVEAGSKLRALAILDQSLQGESVQPSEEMLRKIGRKLQTGKPWQELFPGVASIDLTTKGYGPSFDLRITKKEGVPVYTVPEGTPGASPVAIRRVSELSYYCLGHRQVSEQVGLTPPKTTAVMKYLNIEEDVDSFKLITVGNTKHKRYSHKAVQRIKEVLEQTSIEEIWDLHKPQRRR